MIVARALASPARPLLDCGSRRSVSLTCNLTSLTVKTLQSRSSFAAESGSAKAKNGPGFSTSAISSVFCHLRGGFWGESLPSLSSSKSKDITRRISSSSQLSTMASGSVDIGFLGLGIMGVGMARNLIKRGHKVTVWNRTLSKCDPLVAEGASVGQSPAEVVSKCSITIAMLADPAAALETALGASGVVEAMGPGKGYVDMSTVDGPTSIQIGEAIRAKGGRFLEAPVSGSKKPAEDGTLIILAAGDESLFTDAASAFEAMGKKSFYLGETGNGARMKLVVNMIMGSMMTGFAEGLALAEKSGLSPSTLLEVLDNGAIANPMFKMKGPAMVSGQFAPAFPLKHQQKDLRLALALGDEVDQPLPVAAAANEVFKQAKKQGHGDEDFSAVYKAVGPSS